MSNQSITNSLLNVNSKYILELIFNNISQRKFLNIIRYNEKLQNLLNKTIVDYYEEYSKIVIIEITLSIPQSEKLYGKLSKYNNIYINGNKEEFKKDYFDSEDNGKTITIKEYSVCYFPLKIFHDWKYVEKFDIIKYQRPKIKDASYMFRNFENLREINIYDFPDSCINMADMFCQCNSLEKVKFHNFKGEYVKDMSRMFEECRNLKEVDFSNFNTENVVDMNSMFFKCYKLQKLNVTCFNTKSLKKFDSMFEACYSLKEIDISNFNFDKVETYGLVFKDCGIQQLKMSFWQIEFAEKFSRIYEGINGKIIFVDE